MPEQPPPSLEALARAAVEAWRQWGSGDLWRQDINETMYALAERLSLPEMEPPRALDYMLPVKLQVELRFACALVACDKYPSVDDMRGIVIEARRLARLLLDLPQPTPEAVRRDDQIRAVVADLRGHRDTCGVYDCTFTDAIPYEHRAAATAELAKDFGLWWDSWIEPKLKKIDEMLTPA